MVNSDYRFTQFKLRLANDSILILNKIVLEQDSLGKDYQNVIVLKDSIILFKDTIQKQQNLQIIDLKTNVKTLKKQRNNAVGVGIFGVILGIVFGVVF
jgi:hypothetical protein